MRKRALAMTVISTLFIGVLA
ncbi:MAG: hypothetical protein JWN30_2264, partial [Bacilli bacterium]|nr:hypothetical protein [Bacilli bacterium]